MANGKTQKQMVQETHDSMLRLETKLPFIQEDIVENTTRIDSIGNSHGKLKRNFWTLVGILIGSGVIGVGVNTLLGG